MKGKFFDYSITKIKQFLKDRKCYKLIAFIKYLMNIFEVFKKSCKMNLLKCKRLWFYNKRRRITSDYLKSHQICKLTMGGGSNILKGWLNTDLFPYDNKTVVLDVTKPFFFDDNTFDYIFSEHMIEHLSYPEGLRMLKECHRILKPNGKIRISTPDLKVHLDLFRKDKIEIQERYIDWISNNWLQRAGIYSRNEVFVLNLLMHAWGHRFLYNFETLKSALEEAGFREIVRASCGLSSDENLRDLEKHGDTIKDIKGIKKQFGSSIDNQMNDFMTIILEAVKR